MTKRELECGYTPLRPWERLFVYVGFFFATGLTFWRAHSEGVSLELVVLMAAALLATSCALVAFWDARTTVHLRRRERRQRQKTRRQVINLMADVPETQFSNSRGSWNSFEDPAPTT